MSDRSWVCIVSWHAVRTPTRFPNRYRTMCGRNAWGPVQTVLPADKSCETCLRVIARQDDQPEEVVP